MLEDFSDRPNCQVIADDVFLENQIVIKVVSSLHLPSYCSWSGILASCRRLFRILLTKLHCRVAFVAYFCRNSFKGQRFDVLVWSKIQTTARKRDMGRNSKKQSIPATELFNFHFPTPAVPLEASVPRHNFHGTRTKNQKFHRTAEDRASARKNASTAFFSLHSSPDFAFVLTRRSHSKVQGGSSYTFSGCDSPVSWESVRIVKHIVPLEEGSEVTCPICLCDFVCPRVTKCGHSYCLSCIVHHVQSHAASNPYSDVSCPCCFLPLALSDLRPVMM